jgi:hypothetical protein
MPTSDWSEVTLGLFGRGAMVTSDWSEVTLRLHGCGAQTAMRWATSEVGSPNSPLTGAHTESLMDSRGPWRIRVIHSGVPAGRDRTELVCLSYQLDPGPAGRDAFTD